jgi:YidC/Oxa1 family membrane protein insertase
MTPFVLGSILSPLENALHDLLFGIQHATGLPWAWAIILLTVCVRLAILPLAIIQMRSMRGMQKIAPELQKLKQKHKGDSQKLQQEMMLLYKEHGVNPVGSCLPLLFQLPVFMGLFFVLRGFSSNPPEGDLSFLGGFIPNISVHVDQAGYAGWVLIGAYVASQLASTLLMPTGADPQQQMMRRLHGHAVHLRLLRDPFPGRVDDHWISTNSLDGRAGGAAQGHGAPPNAASPKRQRAACRASRSRAAQGTAGRGAVAKR